MSIPYTEFKPGNLRTCWVTENGDLKPSCTTDSYSGGDPSAVTDLKPSIADYDTGLLKPGLVLDGALKPSLRPAGEPAGPLPPPNDTCYCQFDGANSKLHAGTDPLLRITGAITLCAWARPIEPTQNGCIVGKFRTSANNRGYRLQQAGTFPDNEWFFAISEDGVNEVSLRGGPAPVYNQWQFVCAVFEPLNYMRLFYNGAQVEELTGGTVPAAIFDNTAGAAVGAWNTADLMLLWTGDLQHVRIYDKPLTPAQIINLYNNVNVTDGLVAHWPLVDRLDSGPNGIHLTNIATVNFTC